MMIGKPPPAEEAAAACLGCGFVLDAGELCAYGVCGDCHEENFGAAA